VGNNQHWKLSGHTEKKVTGSAGKMKALVKEDRGEKKYGYNT